jgi:hypothetical protein
MKTNTHPLNLIIGHQHPKCYARADHNCSLKISKEHFISEILLKQIQLNNIAKIAGLKWQQKESFNLVPVSGLASSILCERHNNALSPLDACMGLFSEAIRAYDAALRANTATQASEQRSFSGDDIERWMVKCILGLTTSKNLNITNVKPECINLLFGNISWPEGWGLYFPLSADAPIYHSDSFLIETQVDPARQLILAARFTIRGLPMVLCFGKPEIPESMGLFHPESIIFKSGACEKVLVLSWASGVKNSAILLERAGTYDGPPPNWPEWERNG